MQIGIAAVAGYLARPRLDRALPSSELAWSGRATPRGGHPDGATGVRLVYEIFNPHQGRAGKYQRDKAERSSRITRAVRRSTASPW